jgi:hypothetical protein
MKCNESRVLMQLGEDGEASANERQELNRHLVGCLACRRMAAWLDELRNLYPTVEPPAEDLADDVVSALKVGGRDESNDSVRETIAEPMRLPIKPKRFLLARTLRRLVIEPGRKTVEPSQRSVSWRANAADSMVIGFRGLKTAMRPTLEGQSHALGWIRIAAEYVTRMNVGGK